MTTGGGQTGGDDMEHRVDALEKTVARIEDKLDRLIEEFRDFRQDVMVRFARIEEKLETKASAVDLAELKEKLETRASAIDLSEVKEKLETRAAAIDLSEVKEKLETRASAIDLSELKEKLETRAAAIELAEIKGRVSVLPTIFQMITLVFGILGGAFLILKFGLPHGP